jgi:hypothetical protein
MTAYRVFANGRLAYFRKAAYAQLNYLVIPSGYYDQHQNRRTRISEESFGTYLPNGDMSL